MPALNPAKLHVVFRDDISPSEPVSGRRYTLTHSDQTGDLFLTVGLQYDRKALSELQTRLMRDEVLGEWREMEPGSPSLHLMCHVSGRLLNFGAAGWRYRIFRHHMPQVLQALRYGDRALYDAHKWLDDAPLLIHFNSHREQFNKVENWGKPADYRVRGANSA